MDAPIISPWLIYFIETANTFVKACICSMAVLTLTGFIIVTAIVMTDEFKDFVRSYKKWLVACIIIEAALWLFIVFIPSRDAMYSMLIAKHATPANFIKAKELGKDFKDTIKKDVIDIIKESRGEKKK